MDPYVERHWLDVHTALIGDTRRALNRSLPQGLVARVEERVAVEADHEYLRRIGPDVRVFSPSTADPDEGKGGVVIDAPYKLVVDDEPAVERFIRIIDESGQLVTVIEFISPANKERPGLTEYQEKRNELLAGGVHVVEVDLVREGDWRALMRPQRCPPDAVSMYRVTIRTAQPKPAGYLFPITLRQQLPEIPIPLRAGEGPTRLALQPLFDAVYEDGRYDHTIDYSMPLQPALPDGDREWAEEMLHSSGRA